MDAEEDYSTVLVIGNERRHLLCTKLPYSEWYLVVVMPYGSLNEEITHLSRQWSSMAIVRVRRGAGGTAADFLPVHPDHKAAVG